MAIREVWRCLILLVQEGYECGCRHETEETADSGEIFEYWHRHCGAGWFALAVWTACAVYLRKRVP